MRKRALPGVVAIGLLAASLSAFSQSASAVTTVTPSESGAVNVVRDAKVTVDVDRTAMTYYRGSASTAFAPQGAVAVAAGVTVCRGDSTTNNSPRTRVTVTGPDGVVVADRTSGVRDLSVASFLAPAPKHPPIEAAPSATNYRGDFPDADAFHGMKVPVDLTGKPAGTYTVTTTDTNKVRTGLFGGCSTGTPGPGNTVVAGDKVTTQTFEYRPWQATFTDVLGNGRVSANISPTELSFTVGSKSSGVIDSGAATTFFSYPSGPVPLPTNPTTCAEDAADCVPPTAVPCSPGDGCTPRIMVVNLPATADAKRSLAGFFDLDTKAFIADASIDGTRRLLLSVGTDGDQIYQDLLAQLVKGAADADVDLASLLATTVVLSDGTTGTSLSLLNGLQIDPSTRPGGVQIQTGPSVQAGIVLHVYADLRLDGGACTTRSGSSATGRFDASTADGYTVRESDSLPPVPDVGPLGPLTGGPVWHIATKPRPGAALNVASAAVGVDSAAGEANGYPVWVAPFLSGINTAKPTKSFEFVGTGTWTSSQTALGNGCIVANGLLGTGVTVLDNPLPVGLGTLMQPLTHPTPDVRALHDDVLKVVTDVIAPITSNETVDSTLGQVLGLLALD